MFIFKIDCIFMKKEIDRFGTIRYYVDNVLHREDGPAVEHSNGTKYWYKNGEFHREDGPAIEFFTGLKKWYLNNVYYGVNEDFTNKSWKRFIKTLIFS